MRDEETLQRWSDCKKCRFRLFMALSSRAVASVVAWRSIPTTRFLGEDFFRCNQKKKTKRRVVNRDEKRSKSFLAFTIGDTSYQNRARGVSFHLRDVVNNERHLYNPPWSFFFDTRLLRVYSYRCGWHHFLSHINHSFFSASHDVTTVISSDNNIHICMSEQVCPRPMRMQTYLAFLELCWEFEDLK